MIRVVFVCTANICRSPMAEGLLNHLWSESTQSHGKNNTLMASSMGVQMLDGQPASDHAIAVCAENGIDITSHRSRALHPGDLKRADVVLTMEPYHRNHLRLLAPVIKDKVFLLASWPNEKAWRNSIKDPFGRSLRLYRKTYKIIDGHIRRIIPLLSDLKGALH